MIVPIQVLVATDGGAQGTIGQAVSRLLDDRFEATFVTQVEEAAEALRAEAPPPLILLDCFLLDQGKRNFVLGRFTPLLSRLSQRAVVVLLRPAQLKDDPRSVVQSHLSNVKAILPYADLEAIRTYALEVAWNNGLFRREARVGTTLYKIVGDSAQLRNILERIERCAHTPFAVLITGETGTAKSTVARIIHGLSDRANKGFVLGDLSTVPPEQLESRLFGTKPGAYPGAQDKMGLFEEASGGTLFLDEIGRLPFDLQPKLLTVLKDKTFRRVGGTRDIPMTARIISATNSDLDAAVANNNFAPDLFWRLAGVRLKLPALRDRREDIRPIALHIAAQFRESSTSTPISISEAALAALYAHDWPGNVHELENAIKGAITTAGPGIMLEPKHFSELLAPPAHSPRLPSATGTPVAQPHPDGAPDGTAAIPPSANLLRELVDLLRKATEMSLVHAAAQDTPVAEVAIALSRDSLKRLIKLLVKTRIRQDAWREEETEPLLRLVLAYESTRVKVPFGTDAEQRLRQRSWHWSVKLLHSVVHRASRRAARDGAEEVGPEHLPPEPPDHHGTPEEVASALRTWDTARRAWDNVTSDFVDWICIDARYEDALRNLYEEALRKLYEEALRNVSGSSIVNLVDTAARENGIGVIPILKALSILALRGGVGWEDLQDAVDLKSPHHFTRLRDALKTLIVEDRGVVRLTRPSPLGAGES